MSVICQFYWLPSLPFQEPTHYRIQTFNHPATELKYPAVTVCKKHNYDVAEYLRAVFDNFDASHDTLIQDHFKKLLGFNLSRVSVNLAVQCD